MHQRNFGSLQLRVGILFFSTALATLATIRPANINLEYVAQAALDRARRPFHSPRADLPAFLKADKLDYDAYREIRFRRERALWNDGKSPYMVEFFHPGYLYEEPVRVNEFVPGHVQDIRFVSDFFDYGAHRFKQQVPANTGYAGFRVLCALNDPGRMDELGAFLGASYYRLLGKGQRYGQSARGLALDCGESDRSEEFPIFTDWWLGKPEGKDDPLHLFALLDSVSCTGAYEFRIRPGETTVADIDAVLFLRERVNIHAADPNRLPTATLGLAPLTSMFWFGPASEARFNDYRSAVHDSDGLLMSFGNGEMLWRPLDNPPRLIHQRFFTTNLVGFGLLQRNRDLAAYEDLFNFYHHVPSVWVQPHGNWGEGEVNLVELSTRYEGLDNIVAFWSPKQMPLPLRPLRFGYTQEWTSETDLKLSTNKVVNTRVGGDTVSAHRRQIAIDFDGPALAALSEADPPQVIASCSDNGVIIDTQALKIPGASAWRVMLKLDRKDENPIDVRCTLTRHDKAVTETWTDLLNQP
ncbi:MAG TPA: glucan biosynthesis protein G [Verrucomicrobiae bacterium]|jgi:glucans biosynthesis protein|nr:glucan biosynthesis protein G [Verrucomicrobiae bacterium]